MTDSSTSADPTSSNANASSDAATAALAKPRPAAGTKRAAPKDKKPAVKETPSAVKEATPAVEEATPAAEAVKAPVKGKKAATKRAKPAVDQAAVTAALVSALVPAAEAPAAAPTTACASDAAIAVASEVAPAAGQHDIQESKPQDVLQGVPQNAQPGPDNAPDDEVDDEDHSERLIQEPRVWQDDGWTARVMKNEDDEGWAVAMTLDGEPEPALVGPWTMGRDKKNPKPLDGNAFSVLVKTAYEVRRRHEQAQHALLHKSVTVEYQGERCKVSLQIVPDEYEPYAFLRAFDPLDDLLAEVRVEANFKLSNQSASQWIANDFRRPGG